MQYDYFYGGQADSYSFYRIPRVLICGDEFKCLSTDAKLLYGLLLDRMGLSARNGWFDCHGRVFIYYTVDEIQEDLCCGHVKAGKLLAELDSKKGIGLIERVKQGQGKPSKIYVKQFTSKEALSIRATDSIAQDGLKTEVQIAAFDTSRPTESSGADLQKADANYTKHSYTNPSYTYLSINRVDADRWDYIEQVKEQIDYGLLAESYPNDDPESFLELIADVLGNRCSTIKIGGEALPAGKVQDRFRRLRFEHVAYVIDSLRSTSSKIKNIKAYLLRALYDAPLTIGPFYSAAVRHDEEQYVSL